MLIGARKPMCENKKNENEYITVYVRLEKDGQYTNNQRNLKYGEKQKITVVRYHRTILLHVRNTKSNFLTGVPTGIVIVIKKS